MKFSTTIEFIDETNKLEYQRQTLDWISSDFIRQGKPEHHFWYNKDTIKEAFDRCEALVIFNSRKNVVGYMIWRDKNGGVEIDIVEIKKNYRKKGICKKMLQTFSDKFPNISVLTAMILPQAEAAFSKMGWNKVHGTCYRSTKYFKIVRPVLQPLDTLPDGRVIAVCSEDYYKVKANPDAYNHLMHYFPIDLDTEAQLRERIVTQFIHDGYVGIYFNKELIVDGRARYVFEPSAYDDSSNIILIISKIAPIKPDLFYEKGFLPQPQPESNNRKRLLPLAFFDKLTSTPNLEATNDFAQQTDKKPTFFQPANSALQIENSEPPQITTPKP